MVWTPELVEAEVLRRREGAERGALIRQLREARNENRPRWRRFRSHPAPADDQTIPDQRAA